MKKLIIVAAIIGLAVFAFMKMSGSKEEFEFGS
jgi:hypothetical protein